MVQFKKKTINILIHLFKKGELFLSIVSDEWFKLTKPTFQQSTNNIDFSTCLLYLSIPKSLIANIFMENVLPIN